MGSPRAVVQRLLAAACGGAMVAIALPPIGWWPSAALGVALLCTTLRDVTRRVAFLCGLFFGLAQMGIGLYFTLSFTGLGYFVLIVGEALFIAFAAMATPPICSATGLCGSLTLAEWARDHVPFGGLPLGGLPLAAVGSPLAPLARVGGPAVLTLATVAIGTSVATLGEAFSRAVPPERRLRAIRSGTGVLVAVIAAAALSTFAPDGGMASRTIRVAAVQGGGPRGVNQAAEPGGTALERTTAAAQEVSGVQLELWPEDTIPLPAGPKSTVRAILNELGGYARDRHIALVVGVTQPVQRTKFLNEAIAWSPLGRITATREKAHAVPFGEYIPFRSFLQHFVSLAAVPRDAIVGHNDGLLRTTPATLGVLISYETFYPDIGRTAVRNGAHAILIPTNTASYSSTQAPTQELAASRLEAIANGRDVLQAATTGFTALIRPSGEVLQETRLGAASVVIGSIGIRDGWTLYVRFGDLPILVIAALLLGIGWTGEARRRRS